MRYLVLFVVGTAVFYVLSGPSFFGDASVWVGATASREGPLVGELKPMTPNADLPTFQPMTSGTKAPGTATSSSAAQRSDRSELADALRDGRLKEDPTLQRARSDVLAAFTVVERSPCDAAARDAMQKAMAEFMKSNLKATRGREVEVLIVNGRSIEARGFLNTQASEAFDRAANEGLVDMASVLRGFNPNLKPSPGAEKLAMAMDAPMCNDESPKRTSRGSTRR